MKVKCLLFSDTNLFYSNFVSSTEVKLGEVSVKCMSGSHDNSEHCPGCQHHISPTSSQLTYHTSDISPLHWNTSETDDLPITEMGKNN